MKISVVTISFNQAAFLERAILSVVSQPGVELDYIVVDPGSSDGSRDIINRYRNQIQHRVFEPDSGPADGLNKGFARATGQIYAFLNADDEFLPGAFDKVVRLFARHPDADAISGCGYFVDAEGGRLRRIASSKLTPRLYAHGGVSVFQQGTFFRAEWFARSGGFNAANRTCWDAELFLDMALAGARFRSVADELAVFRLHGESITGSGRMAALYQQDQERLFEKVLGRRRQPFDGVTAMAARAYKYLADPAYLARRLQPHRKA